MFVYTLLFTSVSFHSPHNINHHNTVQYTLHPSIFDSTKENIQLKIFDSQ